MNEREYIVLEEWTSYVQVVISAPSKKIAIERAKDLLADPDSDDIGVLLAGNPTGRYEARRAAVSSGTQTDGDDG